MRTTEYTFSEHFNDYRVVVFVTIYLIFLIGLGSFGYMVGREKVIASTTAELNAPMAKAIPSLSLNMQSLDAQSGSVRLAFSLEVAVKDQTRIQNYMPKIMDRVQTVLNETPIEQLKNKTDLHFVRENMLSQINQVSGPVHVRNLYIDKLLTTN